MLLIYYSAGGVPTAMELLTSAAVGDRSAYRMIDSRCLRAVGLSLICALLCICRNASADGGASPKMWSDPVTRYIHIKYMIPANAPDQVEVSCSWSPAGKNEWRPARITPLISETALTLASSADRDRWVNGLLTERRAAGLERTVVFNPYPEAQTNGWVDAEFKVEISTPKQEKLATEIIPIKANNTDVMYIDDWSKVLQKDLISNTPADGKWQATKEALLGKAGVELSYLTYPLNLRGSYAIFVATDTKSGPIALRLTGDERTENVESNAYDRETLWRWTKMERQHLVIKQRHYFTGYCDSSLRYVKLVPLPKSVADNLNAKYEGKHDKILAAYFEPYSWSFYNNIKENYQHREPMSAYQEAGADIVDTQLARFGMKAVYETRKSDQLLYSTEGDPIADKVPVTDNVGRMQQYTNMYQSELKYATEMGFSLHANFGATACYPGSPLEGDFSRTHPEWRVDGSLRYDVPAVRSYMLSMYREALEIGAPGISLDFCRYPEGVDSAKTCTTFMRQLRKLADEYSKIRGKHIPIMVRFPAAYTRKWDCFDYRAWTREGLVDYLCPSNIQGVYQLFDVSPYKDAIKGTKCKLLPVVDALEWGPIFPGQYVLRVKQLYDAGADGVYIYQADDPIVYHPRNRKDLSLARSSEAINRWCRNDAEERKSHSKGIYITGPIDGKGYNYWERMRIWIEGVKLGTVETYVDGKLITKVAGPPYILGYDGYESDKVVPKGEHTLLIRAQDGKGWIEQEFKIKGYPE